MKEQMEDKKLTQLAFSQSINADQSYLSKFLRGENNSISLKYVSEFCREYGLSMDWLVLEIGQKHLNQKYTESEDSNVTLNNLNELIQFQREKIKNLELELDSFKNRDNVYEKSERYSS